MEIVEKMWCVLTEKHGYTGGEEFSRTTLAYTRKESIAKFIDGSGNSWRYWKRAYNFKCKKVNVTIEYTPNPLTTN